MLLDGFLNLQELFQGKAKGFDVEKALEAKSVRDFEKLISSVSHGFNSIEDFYSKSSTRSVVGNVKIPVLYIQVHVFYIFPPEFSAIKLLKKYGRFLPFHILFTYLCVHTHKIRI